MIHRLLALMALLVPGSARSRWREEWLAETRAVLTRRGRTAAVRMLCGAIPDALALRRSAEPGGPSRSPFRGLGQDLRYGVRSLLQAPGFSLSVIGSLAIGIAVTATAFTFLNAINFRPFPGVREQDRLVNVHLSRGCGWPGCSIYTSSLQDYQDLRQGLTLLEDGLAAKANAAIAVTIHGRAHSLRASMVSANYFDVLGVRPALGRTFMPAEAEPASAGVVVIAHTLWQRQFAADPGVLGSLVELATGSAQIIGVAPRHFVGASRGDLGVAGPGIELWVPLVLADRLSASLERHPAGIPLDNERDIFYLGRLKPGIDSAQLSAQAQSVAAGIAAARSRQDIGVQVSVSGVSLNHSATLVATTVVILAVPGLVLAIACLNAANLLLARGAHRARELAVRLALGATRWRIIRQLLLDSLLLSLLAAALSLPLAQWSVSFGTVFFGLPMPVDARVMAFTIAIGLLSGVAFSLAPALRMSAAQPGGALGSSRSGDDNPRQARGRRTLVIAQVALSLGLLAVGTQLITFMRAEAPSGGTDADRLLMASFDVGQVGMDDATARIFYRELLRRMSERPEADGIGLARRAVLWTFGGGVGQSPIIVWRQEDTPRQGELYLGGYAGGDLFRAAGLRVVAGRTFTRTDEGDRAMVAIVNVPMARKLFGGAAAVGRVIRVAAREQKPGDAIDVTIVGVVEAAREPGYSREPVPAAYVPVPLGPEPKLTLYAKSSGPTAALADTIRAVVGEINPRLPPVEIRTLEAIGGHRMMPAVIGASAVSVLGVIALLLATAGLYGVTSYTVTLRSREIGVRLALGAEPAAVLRMVLTQGLRLAAVGAVIGGAAAVVISKVVQSQLRGAQGLDLRWLVGSFLLLAAAMALASAIPARRAARVDPISVLRQE